MELKSSHVIMLAAEDGAARIAFDLATVNMSAAQAKVVRKLFSQDPVAILAEGEHRLSKEKGKPGPASRYLSSDEFESIRALGVRLGTKGELAATACDFCLHCVKLEALPNAIRNHN
jgi:hypothetical protein